MIWEFFVRVGFILGEMAARRELAAQLDASTDALGVATRCIEEQATLIRQLVEHGQ